jgi:cytochrome c oxidase assembly factor CtaG
MIKIVKSQEHLDRLIETMKTIIVKPIISAIIFVILISIFYPSFSFEKNYYVF